MKKLTIALLALLSLAVLATCAAASEATDTIDYAILRLAELQPTAQRLGTEYVQYVVFKETLAAWILSAIVMSLAVALAALLVKVNRCKHDSSGAGDGAKSATAVISAVLAVFVPLALTHVYDAVLANHNPLMYAISQIAGK